MSQAASVEDNAKTQVVFREVNERIAGLTLRWNVTGMSLFICECSNPKCAEALEMRPAEYERVRAHAARFVVAAGHEGADERVVMDNDRFLVVENIGVAAEIARASDPRNG